MYDDTEPSGVLLFLWGVILPIVVLVFAAYAPLEFAGMVALAAIVAALSAFPPKEITDFWDRVFG